MQRHPALRNLSSEHQTGLVLTRRARQAATQEASVQAGAWEAIRKIFRSELAPHFQREEQGLLPVLRVAGEVDLADRTLREHRSIHFLVLEEGRVGLGNSLDLLDRPAMDWPLSRILHLLYRDRLNTGELAQLGQLSPLTESWRLLARQRLEHQAVEDWSRRLNTPEGAEP